MQPFRDRQRDHDGADVQRASGQALALGTAAAVACDLEGGKGRAGRKRAGNTGQQRSLTVNNGHSKTGPDQGRSPLTRYDARISLGVRFPPAPPRPKTGIYQGFYTKW